MMAVIKYRGHMTKLTGKNEETVNAASVSDVLSYIRDTYGKAAHKEAKRMLIAVNGTNIQHLGRYKTALKDGDSVAFFPLSAGG